MDADTKVDNIYTEENMEIAGFFLSESEKKLMDFAFAKDKKTGYAQIKKINADNIIFSVYDFNMITKQVNTDPREVVVPKELAEREICSVIQDDFTKEEISFYFFEFDKIEVIVDLPLCMPKTFEYINRKSAKTLLKQEDFNTLKQFPIEGIGAFYIKQEPVCLIESFYLHDMVYGEIRHEFIFNLDTFTSIPEHQREDLSLLFFPKEADYGYQIKDFVSVKDESNFSANFNKSAFASSDPFNIVKKEDFPMFNRQINKINVNNSLDLYIEDPFEQREIFLSDLKKEYSKEA